MDYTEEELIELMEREDQHYGYYKAQLERLRNK